VGHDGGAAGFEAKGKSCGQIGDYGGSDDGGRNLWVGLEAKFDGEN